jgi:hypothetical protein
VIDFAPRMTPQMQVNVDYGTFPTKIPRPAHRLRAAALRSIVLRDNERRRRRCINWHVSMDQ